MHFWKYFVAMSIGTIGWMFGLAEVGKAVGSQWPKWKSHLDIVDYLAVAFVVLLVLWFLYEKVLKPRTRGRTQTDLDA